MARSQIFKHYINYENFLWNTSQALVMLNPPPDSPEGFISDNKGKTAKGYVQAGVVICMKR